MLGADFCDTTHCQFLREPPAPGSAFAAAARAPKTSCCNTAARWTMNLSRSRRCTRGVAEGVHGRLPSWVCPRAAIRTTRWSARSAARTPSCGGATSLRQRPTASKPGWTTTASTAGARFRATPTAPPLRASGPRHRTRTWPLPAWRRGHGGAGRNLRRHPHSLLPEHDPGARRRERRATLPAKENSQGRCRLHAARFCATAALLAMQPRLLRAQAGREQGRACGRCRRRARPRARRSRRCPQAAAPHDHQHPFAGNRSARVLLGGRCAEGLSGPLRSPDRCVHQHLHAHRSVRPYARR